MHETLMFGGSLNPTWPERTRRGWTALTSFGLQVIAAGILLLIPLLRPVGLPSLHPLSTPISLGRPDVGDTISPHVNRNLPAVNPTQIIFMRPSSHPINTQPGIDEGPPQIGIVGGPYIGSATAKGDPRGFPNLGDGARPIPLAPVPAAPSRPLHISQMSEGSLIRKIQPNYPPLARSARIQGSVVLQAVIGKEGTIENLKVLSGHPMLAQSAIEAVRQWRYRPYILNGEPIEVETQITVNFSLAGS
jgi:periplasmic protein TonB